ncbi:MAG: hypothetical protein MUD13_02590 [Candidatus Nanopelagicales bacterium]|jgi:hypothetical protein|nr:hypothetical protein [Candidatus Nanopelagicales bacterium]
MDASTVDPTFDHLVAMSTPRGLYEHARGNQPRRAHGFCLDDNGRLLGVCARVHEPGAEVLRLARIALDYTLEATQRDGRMRNRRTDAGVWGDRPGLGDHWGRAVWGLGQVVASPWCDGGMRTLALGALHRAAEQRSPWRRTMAHAAVGAADALAAAPGDRPLLGLLLEARTALTGSSGVRGMQRWPEPRLTYANALIPEAHLAIGAALGDQAEVRRGLAQLEWLVALQTPAGHLSPVPSRGWAPGEPLPAFDQQPIEVASLAEAAARAHAITGDRSWGDVVVLAAEWFLGRNDVGVPLYDPATGGGCDGLTAVGPNPNQGAESTLAALATLQLAARFARVRA